MLFALIVLPTLLIGYGIFELIDDNDDDGNDDQTINGSDDSDFLSGANGNDLISGAVGNDSIEGGIGGDTLTGDEGNDTVLGQEGRDSISGGAGDDIALGGQSQDTINGDDGDDVILGEQGDDDLIGGNGDDLVLGGAGSDILTGSGGKDWVEGEEGDDSLSGGFGFDTLIGGEGNDNLRGENGGDVLFGGTVEGTPLDTAQLVQLRDGASLADVLGTNATANVVLLDDGNADDLSGGNSDDTLYLGAGDAGAGDAGADTFAILADQATNQAQDFALIKDYTSTEDAIAVVVQDGTTPVISVTADGNDSIISIGDTVLARVTGAASTLTAANVTIIASPTVGALDPNT
jgi:Ca2+-binding RTX toxin-like protein